MVDVIDHSGERIAFLTVLHRTSRPGITSAFWTCLCDCGNTTEVRGAYLRNGHTTSCGCKRGNHDVIHGGARRKARMPEYHVWAAMRRRCQDTNSKSYKDYGGRGITVCDRWQDFANFIEDMGQRPSPEYSIERKDNDRGYSPDNCIWATRDIQAKNRRPPKKLTHCRKGHALNGDNLYQAPDGRRGCRICRRANMRKLYEARAV